MQTLSSLDQIAKNLEHHENSNRIKKLIFCACKNIWENDQDTLDKFQLQELISELCSLNPTIDNLSYTLSEVVKTLNKQTEYALVAKIILNAVETLYIITEESTGIIFQQTHQQEQIALTYRETKSPYNQFDLRQNIMKYTNPLRAKIVLFSALYNQFTFKEEDWLKLKKEELDILLQRLFDSCATLKELESKLNITVISLGNSDEDIQAASAIIRAMQGFYGNILSSTKEYPGLNSYSFPEVRTITNPHDQPALTDFDDDIDEYDDDNTCQVLTQPIQDPLNKKQ